MTKPQAAVAEYEEFKGNVAFVGTKASPSDQGYHWNTNAETYCPPIGEATGNAMETLCEKKPEKCVWSGPAPGRIPPG